ncbi:hypothetical protein NMG60_11023057 [Bertholletia excelsa]
MALISFLPLLFLLCLSFSSSSARPLGAARKEPEKKFLLPNNKNDEKASPARVSVEPRFKPSSSNDLRVANGETTVKQSKVDKDDNQPKGDGEKFKASSGASQKESLFSVSWRVPHKKRGEKQPGFSLDYSPPKTHPPVHN